MPDIVISECMDEEGVEHLRRAFSVCYDPLLADKPEILLDRLRSAHALIVGPDTRVDSQLLAAAPRLRVVALLDESLDNIDMSACEAAGVQVFPATDNNESVADYVMAGLLLLLRPDRSHEPGQADACPADQRVGRAVDKGHLGLVGFGRTARQVARKAKALGIRVSAFDPFVPETDAIWRVEGVEPLSLAELLRQVDGVSLHVPLVESTRQLINADSIGLMKPGAILINSSRSGVLDDVALTRALRENRLGGALLGVFETQGLTEAPNLILTPLVAGGTDESSVWASRLTAEKVRRALLSDRTQAPL